MAKSVSYCLLIMGVEMWFLFIKDVFRLLKCSQASIIQLTRF
jgi:hypothetical protein